MFCYSFWGKKNVNNDVYVHAYGIQNNCPFTTIRVSKTLYHILISFIVYFFLFFPLHNRFNFAVKVQRIVVDFFALFFICHTRAGLSILISEWGFCFLLYAMETVSSEIFFNGHFQANKRWIVFFYIFLIMLWWSLFHLSVALCICSLGPCPFTHSSCFSKKL